MMEKIHVLRIHRRAAGIVFPFDRVYLFPNHLENTIPRVFPNALVFPLTKRVVQMLHKVNRVCGISRWGEWEHRYYPKQRPSGRGQPDWEIRDNEIYNVINNRKEFLGVVAQLYLQGSPERVSGFENKASTAYVSAYQKRPHGESKPTTSNKFTKVRHTSKAEAQWESFGDRSQGKDFSTAMSNVHHRFSELRLGFLRDIVGSPSHGYLLVNGKKHKTPCLACPKVMECTVHGISYGDGQCEYTNIKSKYSPLVGNVLGALQSLQSSENNLGDGVVLEDASFAAGDWQSLWRDYVEGNEE